MNYVALGVLMYKFVNNLIQNEFEIQYIIQKYIDIILGKQQTSTLILQELTWEEWGF